LGLAHEPHEAFNQIIDIAEGSCLRAIAIHGHIFAGERLHARMGNMQRYRARVSKRVIARA
jgi:hypothetical protein